MLECWCAKNRINASHSCANNSENWWEQLAVRVQSTAELHELNYWTTELNSSISSKTAQSFILLFSFATSCSDCLTSGLRRSSTRPLSSWWMAPDTELFSTDPLVYSLLILWPCSCCSDIIPPHYTLVSSAGTPRYFQSEWREVWGDIEMFNWLFMAVVHKLKHLKWTDAAGLSYCETGQ